MSFTPAEVSNMLLSANLAALAYGTSEGKTRAQQDAAWLSYGYTLVDLVIETTTDTHVSIAVSDTEIVIAVKGTNDRVNMFQDVNIRMIDWMGHLVHVGALGAYLSARAAIMAAIIPRRTSSRGYRFIGHSLGAMIVTYLAYEIMSGCEGVPPASQSYTYGSPRVGSLSFSKAYAALSYLTNTYRIVHLDDIVPTVPFGGLYHHVTGFVHVGDQGAFVGPFTSWFRELVGIAKRCEAVVDLQDVPAHYMQNYIAALEKVVVKAKAS